MTEHLHLDHGPVVWPAIVVHGGAGTYARIGSGPSEVVGRLEAAVDEALDAGWKELDAGDALQAVIAAVRLFEDHGEFNAGRGSVPTTDGTVQMDAGVMDGGGRTGAVACVTRHSAVAAAEAVYRLGGPVLLAGPDADAFASARGVPAIEPLRDEREDIADPPALEGPASAEGTVGAVAVTADGRFAAATSTGGRAGQIPGRVGDTPVAGAGFWAEPGCAVSATGAGEAFLVAGFCRLAAGRHVAGSPVYEGLQAGLDTVARYGGQGGGIALGGDRTWAAAFNTRAMARGVRHGGGRRTVIIG